MKLKPETGRYFFNSSGGSEDFLIKGETMAFLKPAGTAPSVREQLTSLVIEGRRISKHSFTRKVGHGSSRQDLVGDLVITFRTASSESDLKRSNLGTSEGVGRVNESVFVKESLILLILSEKKVTKQLVRPV